MLRELTCKSFDAAHHVARGQGSAQAPARNMHAGSTQHARRQHSTYGQRSSRGQAAFKKAKMNLNKKASDFNFEEGETLLFNKPLHWTSFDVVNKVRQVLKNYTGQKKLKVGHAGTLDPLATGLLLICTGKMTKKIDGFQGQEKEYTGTLLLGATTPSFDLETEVDKHFETSKLKEEELHAAAQTFTGEIEQAAPAYSALKIEGERAYEKARRGEKPAIRVRRIHISVFELTAIRLPEADFRVVCSKGTYIRSLVHDFGKALNNGACLTVLTRTRIGDSLLANAWEVNDFVQMIKAEEDESLS